MICAIVWVRAICLEDPILGSRVGAILLIRYRLQYKWYRRGRCSVEWTEYVGRCCVKSGFSVYMCPNFLWGRKVDLISSHPMSSSPYLFFLGHLIPLSSYLMSFSHLIFLLHVLISSPYLISAFFFFCFSFSLFIFGPQYCSKKKSIYAPLVF